MNQPSQAPGNGEALAIAVGQVGLSPLAQACGVSYQAVQKWVRQGRAPAERCLAIEQATAGAVTRHDLRPDVFGPPGSSVPASAATAETTDLEDPPPWRRSTAACGEPAAAVAPVLPVLREAV